MAIILFNGQIVSNLPSRSSFKLVLMLFQYSLSAFLLSGTVKYLRLTPILSLPQTYNQPFSKEPCFLSERNHIWTPNLRISYVCCHSMSLSPDHFIGQSQKRSFSKNNEFILIFPFSLLQWITKRRTGFAALPSTLCPLWALLSVSPGKMLLSTILPLSLPNILTLLAPEKISVTVFQAGFFCCCYLLPFHSQAKSGYQITLCAISLCYIPIC